MIVNLPTGDGKTIRVELNPTPEQRSGGTPEPEKKPEARPHFPGV